MGVRRWVGFAALTAIAVAGPARGQAVSEERVRAAIDDGARGLGQAVAGGSPLTGPAGTTGGLGHFLVSAGIGVTSVEIEDPQRPAGTVDFLLPGVGVRGALGISDGIAPGSAVGGFGALDVLGRAGVLGAGDEIEDATSVYGLGIRVGLVGETALSPALSVSLARAWTEEIAYGELDDVSFRGDAAVTSLRADLSKRFVLLSPYVGVGIDRTRIEADYTIPSDLSTSGQAVAGSIEPSSTHTTVYAGLDFSLLLLTASVEGGVHDDGAFAAVAVRAGL